MKSIGALAAHLQTEATTLATCWRVVRQDGLTCTFTDHDQALLLGGEVYLSTAGYRRSAVSNAANGAVDNLDLEGLADALSITDTDIRRGLWDYAEIRVFVVNWQSPETGQVKLRRGWMGEVSADDIGQFTAELRGLAQPLAQRIGGYYSPECRAQFGDAQCKLNLDDFLTAGTVGANPGTVGFKVSGSFQGGDYYLGGVLTFTSGQNLGVRREVLDWNGTDTITLFLPLPYTLTEGDGFTVTAGCQKRLVEDCVEKFGNAINFRGEPYTPGADTLLFVGTHSSGG